MVKTLTTPRFASFFPGSRDMDQLFDHFFNGNEPAPQSAWHTPAALWEGADHLYIEFELPGVKQDDIELTFEKGVLNVAAERKPADEQRNYWHQERRYGRIERQVRLPDTVDSESIEAELREGVLYITLAKRPETQPKKISVKTA